MERSSWIEKVREELDRLGWSDYRFAKEIGAHRTLVSKWMHGRCGPSPRYRAEAAKVLGRPELAQATATADGWA